MSMDLEPLEAAERGHDAAWRALGPRLRRVLFVTQKADVYGAYDPRPDAIFKPGETLLIYLEPVGYGYQPDADGFVRFGVSLDFSIALPDGTLVAGKKDFLTFSSRSRARMKELMLNASLGIDGAPEGDYVLYWTLRDITDGATTEARMPFKLAA